MDARKLEILQNALARNDFDDDTVAGLQQALRELTVLLDNVITPVGGGYICCECPVCHSTGSLGTFIRIV